MWSVSIILLNYNWKEFNKPCIDSILGQNYHDFEIIFVDDASTDTSLEEVKECYQQEIYNKKIIIVENLENTWFAWSSNLWVKNVSKKSEYICFLNNDTIVPNNWLEELIKWIESDMKLWGVWSIILNHWMEAQIKHKIFDDKNIVTSSFFSESVWKKIPDNEFKKWIFHVSVVSWCCFLYRKKLVNEPFKDYYFAYSEDFFLSWIILLQWYKLAIVWNSLVYHVGSGSFGREPSDFKLFHWNKNQIINFLVFYNRWIKLKLFPLFLLIQLWHLFVNVPWKRFKAKYKSWIRIYKNWWKIKKTKKYIMSNAKITQNSFLKQLSCKFNDEVFFVQQKKWQIMIIKITNKIFRFYCKILLIPFEK